MAWPQWFLCTPFQIRAVLLLLWSGHPWCSCDLLICAGTLCSASACCLLLLGLSDFFDTLTLTAHGWEILAFPAIDPCTGVGPERMFLILCSLCKSYYSHPLAISMVSLTGCLLFTVGEIWSEQLYLLDCLVPLPFHLHVTINLYSITSRPYNMGRRLWAAHVKHSCLSVHVLGPDCMIFVSLILAARWIISNPDS